MQLGNQPVNSPDLNVLDLGLLNSIQALQQESCAYDIDELIHCVQSAFRDVPSTALSDTFLTLAKVMELIMKSDGGNLRVPHT